MFKKITFDNLQTLVKTADPKIKRKHAFSTGLPTKNGHHIKKFDNFNL